MGQFTAPVTQAAAKPAAAGGLLQRACACASQASGEFESCKKKRVQRKGAGASHAAAREPQQTVFPHLRRVQVLLHRDEKLHDEDVPASDKASSGDDADEAFIDGELRPIPEGKRLPQEAC